MPEELDGDAIEASQGAASGRERRRGGSLISMRPLPLVFKRGRGKLGFWRRLGHVWRYGIHHPDEDLLGVIDAAADSLLTQIMAAEAALTGSRLKRLHELRAELDRELGDEVPELAVLLGIEAKINALYPPATQRRRAWMIRERFERVAPGQAADYWASERPETDLVEEHDERVRRCDAALAQATARRTSADEALTAARGALEQAQATYDTARGAAPGDAGDLDARLERLQALREAGGEADDATTALESEVGEALNARAALATASASEQQAAAGQAEAAAAEEGARLEREVANARFELQRARSREQKAARAVRAARGTPSAAGAQAKLDTAANEAEAAQNLADAAATALDDHARNTGGGAPAERTGTGAPPADGAAADAGGTIAETRDSGGDAPEPDADAQTLLGYIHSSYLMGIAREKAVRDLMRWLMMRFWTANFVLIAALFMLWLVVSSIAPQFFRLADLVFGLFFIAIVGRVGATMSVVQRLQNAVSENVLARDPILELTRLRTGKNGINLALFSGGVFALLMYVFFASGVPAMVGFDDGLAPTLAHAATPDEAQSEQSGDADGGPADGAKDDDADEAGKPSGDASEASGNEVATQDGNSVGTQDEAAEADAPSGNVQEDVGEPSGTRPSGADQSGVAGTTPAPGGPRVQGTADLKDPQAQAAEVARQRREREAARAELAATRTGFFHVIRDFFLGTPEPELYPEQCKANEQCDPFRQLSGALGFAGRADFFKLLIWAFLAGFAERLVPDALDSLAKRARRRRRQQGTDEETA